MTQQKSVRIEQFKGLNNKDPYNVLTEQERDVLRVFLKEAVNVDVLKNFKVARRAGAEQISSVEHHSLWCHPDGTLAFVARGGELGLLNADFSHVPLATVAYRPVAYTEANHEVFMSDDTSMWVYDRDTGLFTQMATPGTYQRQRHHVDLGEEALYYSEPMPGYALAFGFGRLFVGNEYGLHYSLFGYPRRFNEETDYIPVKELSVIGIVDDGIYVGTEKNILFFSGTNIKKQQVRIVAHYGAVRGTLLHVDADSFGVDNASGRAVVFETTEGKVLGLNSGRIVNLTEKNVSYPVAQIGASLLREVNGQTHHISTFADADGSDNIRDTDLATASVRVAPTRQDTDGFYATDIVVAEVRRAGVLI